MLKILQPDGWAQPKGYANGIAGRGQIIVLGGQIGWDADQQFQTDDFVEQTEQTLQNIVALLAQADAGPEHVVRLTWFITDRESYLANQQGLGAAYRRVMGRHFPTMSVVQVVQLVEERALVEIEATAILPDSSA